MTAPLIHIMLAARAMPFPLVMPGKGPASTPFFVSASQGVDAGAKPRHDEIGAADA